MVATMAAPSKKAPVRTDSSTRPRRAEPIPQHPPGPGEQQDVLEAAGQLLRRIEQWLHQLEQAEAQGWRFGGVELVEASAPDEPWRPLQRRPLPSPTAFLGEVEAVVDAIGLALGAPIAAELGRAPAVRVLGVLRVATVPPAGESRRPPVRPQTPIRRPRRPRWRQAPVWCEGFRLQACAHHGACACRWWQLPLGV